MKWKNDITKMLSIEYPVIQAPMFGVTTPAMVASAISAGCLGSLPLGDLLPEKCGELIRTTRKLTDKPFAINIFTNKVPALTEDIKSRYKQVKAFIEELALQHHLEVALPNLDEITFTNYKEQIEAIFAENCKIVSFTFGNLDEETIQRFKNNDTLLIGTCTSVNEAEILEKSGIDIICVQGIEAGGHRGSFADDNIPKIGGFSLLSQVNDAVKAPLIYAGGIYNAKTLLASHTLGAKGFQIGSLLLSSTESALKEFEKEKLRTLTENEIVLTKSFSGRYARGIKNAFIEAMENTNYILPYPYQNKLTADLRKAAKAKENSDFVSIWVGQSINEFPRLSTTNILQNLVRETEIFSVH